MNLVGYLLILSICPLLSYSFTVFKSREARGIDVIPIGRTNDPKQFVAQFTHYWQAMFLSRSVKSFSLFLGLFNSDMTFEECGVDRNLSYDQFTRWLNVFVMTHDLENIKIDYVRFGSDEIRIEYSVKVKNQIGYYRESEMIVWAKNDKQQGYGVTHVNRSFDCGW